MKWLNCEDWLLRGAGRCAKLAKRAWAVSLVCPVGTLPSLSGLRCPETWIQVEPPMHQTGVVPVASICCLQV